MTRCWRTTAIPCSGFDGTHRIPERSRSRRCSDRLALHSWDHRCNRSRTLTTSPSSASDNGCAAYGTGEFVEQSHTDSAALTRADSGARFTERLYMSFESMSALIGGSERRFGTTSKMAAATDGAPPKRDWRASRHASPRPSPCAHRPRDPSGIYNVIRFALTIGAGGIRLSGMLT